jgi:hypothetical protein
MLFEMKESLLLTFDDQRFLSLKRAVGANTNSFIQPFCIEVIVASGKPSDYENVC